MSFASCLAPPPPRLPRGRVGPSPPPPSSLGFGPSSRAAPATGRRLVHVSCFRQEQDGSAAASDDGTGFKYIGRVEMSGEEEVKGEEGGSSNEEEQNYGNRDLFPILLKIKENLQERVSRFWNERWMVPWTGQTIAQVSSPPIVSTSGGPWSIAATSLTDGRRAFCTLHGMMVETGRSSSGIGLSIPKSRAQIPNTDCSGHVH